MSVGLPPPLEKRGTFFVISGVYGNRWRGGGGRKRWGGGGRGENEFPGSFKESERANFPF